MPVVRHPYGDRYHLPPCEPKAGNPIHPLTGAKSLNEPLGAWSIGGQGASLSYNTRRKVPSNDATLSFNASAAPSFGPLWASSLHRSLTVQTDFSGVVRSIQADRGSNNWVSHVRQSDGSYLADAGVSDRLLTTAGGYRYLDAASGTQETYDSSGKLLSASSASGAILSYTYSDGSTPVTTAPAADLLIKVQDQTGRSVQFRYTSTDGTAANAHIAQLIDPNAGVTSFGYDASGNLTSINWPDGKSRQYLYERSDLPWAVTGVTDENTSRLATYGYDAQGRANDTQWAGGADRYSASYGTPPGWNVVETFDSAANVIWRDHYWSLPQGLILSDPLGNAVSLSATLVNGTPRPTSRSQPAGSGCAASSSALSYDTNGNVASSDDFNGSRTCSAFDLSRNLETARVEGLANTQSCAAVTGTGATLPTGSRKVSTVWHPDWRLEAKRAEPGKLTTSVYNGQPDPFNGGATASCAPSTALLPDGKPIAVLCKQVEQATTDPNGSRGMDLAGTPGVTADANYGNVVLLLHMDDAAAGTFTDSSGSGKVPSTVATPLATDPANARYDAASGNFTGGYLLYPDSPDFDMGSGDFTIETWIKFNSASAGSRVFVFGKTASNGGSGTVTLSKGTDSRLAFYWTTAGGSSSVVDAAVVSPNTWYHVAMVRSGGTMTLWKNGVSVGSAPVFGSFILNTNHFGVGVLGDYIGSYGGSSGTRMMGWLDEFRITKGIARYTSAFTPPSGMFGATTTIPGSPSYMDTSAANRVRQWTYNASGQVLTAKDPLNNTTIHVYYTDTTADHTLGDLQSITNAKNQVTTFTKYNKHGQLLESVDPNGVLTTNTYDPRQRLLSTSVGGRTTSYEYDAAGQLLKLTQPDASWVGYEYDAAHRQVAVKDNLGNRIDYVLDNAGNKTSQSVKDPAGNLARSLARSIDALGRVQQTTGRE